MPRRWRSGRTAMGASANAGTVCRSIVVASTLNRIWPTMSSFSTATSSTASSPAARRSSINRDS
jgi:hypothetical protein